MINAGHCKSRSRRLEYSDLSPLTREDGKHPVCSEPRSFRAVVVVKREASAKSGMTYRPCPDWTTDNSRSERSAAGFDMFSHSTSLTGLQAPYGNNCQSGLVVTHSILALC